MKNCSLVPKLYKNYNLDRKSTRLNSSHSQISYAVFCLKKKNIPLIEFKSEILVYVRLSVLTFQRLLRLINSCLLSMLLGHTTLSVTTLFRFYEVATHVP